MQSGEQSEQSGQPTVVETKPYKPWQFQPGVVQNPGGRPKGLARLARELTDNGADLVRFFVAVFNGKAPLGSDGTVVAHKVSHGDRVDAAKWLADRAFGKAPVVVVVDDDDEAIEPEYTVEFLKAAIAAMEVEEAKPPMLALSESANDPSEGPTPDGSISDSG